MKKTSRTPLISFLLLCAACLLGVIALAADLPSSGDKGLEQQVKAALIFNFAKFIEWPPESFPSADTPIVVGVLGSDPFGSVLDETLQGKTAHGRSFAVKRIKEGVATRGCHMLYVGASEEGKYKQLIEEAGGASTVTISEIPGFERNGGMIRIFRSDSKLRFAINPAAAEKARLRVSSQLLKLGQPGEP